MLRRSFLMTTALGTLTACMGTTSPRLGADGRPLPTVYRINPRDTAAIQFRVLDSINALRSAAGASSSGAAPFPSTPRLRPMPILLPARRSWAL